MERIFLFIVMLSFSFTLKAQTSIVSSKKIDSTIPYKINTTVFNEINFDTIIGKAYNLDCSKCDMIYWEDSLISFRTFWDAIKSKPKHEFCRIGPGRLLYRYYDSSSNSYPIEEGEYRLKLRSIQTDTSYTTSSNGNTDSLEIRKYNEIELVKTGYWYESSDTIYTYSGEYVNGIKHGRWMEIKNYDTYTIGSERYLYFNKGQLVKTDTINAVLNHTITDKLLCKSWDNDQYNFKSIYTLYRPKTSQFSRNEITFTMDHKYVIKTHISCAIAKGGSIKEGTWRIDKNKLFLKDNEKENAFEIISLSDIELIIKY